MAQRRFLGAAFRAAPGLRDKVELVTKCDIVAPVGKYATARVKHYDTSAAHIRASVDASLSSMATDRIDLLLIHRPDPLMDHYETGAALDALVAEGKVRAVGVSNFRPWDWDLLQSAMTTKLCTNQVELSLLARDAFNNGDLAHLQRLGVPPMAWSPLAGGALFGEGDAAMRLRPHLERHAKVQGVGTDAVAVAWLLRPSRAHLAGAWNELAGTHWAHCRCSARHALARGLVRVYGPQRPGKRCPDAKARVSSKGGK